MHVVFLKKEHVSPSTLHLSLTLFYFAEMLTWDWIYEEFIKQKITKPEEFSYEEFADLFVEQDKSMIDMYYFKALDCLISDANLKHHCQKLKHEFTVSTSYSLYLIC